jgi:S-adenosylmethionine/arginine decarboxylase-like enzyme
MKYQYSGKHCIFRAENLNTPENFVSVMRKAIAVTGATEVTYLLVSFSKVHNMLLKLFPFLKNSDWYVKKIWKNGLTGCFILSESHLTFHTYPEHKGCFFDLFTCGTRCQPEKGMNFIKKELKCRGSIRSFFR